ncbi:MAG TPA: TonB-dependent receptor [Bryobacteraceae bacterium]|nr:TonB-dependent receptor [Bryobacteraceae bacterium]
MLSASVKRQVFLSAVWLGIAGFAFGQFDSGTVLGTVHDPSNAVVGNASVTLVNVRTGISAEAKTDANGNYEFVNQRLGLYKVRVAMTGFQSVETDPFELTVNARQRVDLILQVGQTSESVTVAGAASLIEGDTSSRGEVINPREIVELPLNGRSYADLTLLAPGVAKSPLENGTDSSRDGSFNVNGGRSELNNFMLDGVDNNAYGTSNQGFSNQVIQPNPDALQMYKVETNNYSAEFGHASGAVINASIKSGGNQFHGEVWEFLRNTDLNAIGFFKPVGGGTLPFNQNQFGAAFGGPIKKDKIFFFADYEGFRRVYHPVQFATVPTTAMLGGDFSAYGAAIANPLNGSIAPGGIIPKSQYSPIAASVLSALPTPNIATAAAGAPSNNYESSPADSIYNDKGDFRFDYFVNSKVSLFARYSQFDTRIFSPPSIPGAAGGNANGNVAVKSKQSVIGATWTISPTSILEARLGIDYMIGGKTPSTLGLSTPQFVIPGEPTDASLAGGLFSVGLSGFSALGRQSSNPQYQDPFVGDPKVNYTKILGRHTLKTGFEFQLIDTAVSDFHPQYGTENFTGFFSDPAFFSNPTALNSLSNALKEVYSLADFIYGAPNHYELDNNPVAHLRQRMYFGYLQDDFKASSKLTLNLGLRYEFATPQYERDNRLANFNPVTNSMIFASGGSLYNQALVHPVGNNWAPRIGLAYQVLPKTVIRAGYGISYVQFNRMGGENLLAYNGPFVVDAAVDQLPTQGICASGDTAPGSCFRSTAQGFPVNFASPQAFNTAITQVRYIPGDNRTGYVQSWHFTIQREIAKNLLLDVAYVGNHDVGLTILSDANQALPNPLNQNLTLQRRRPIQTFSGIEVAFDGGFGTYNGLQVKLEKRYSGGLYFINSFTWSKAIDNAPGHLENYDGDNSRINYYNTPIEKGLSSYNQPLNDTLAVIYDLPIGHGRKFGISNKALDLVVGGWALNLINTMTSGLPLNVSYSATSQATISSLVSERPNLTGQSIYLNSSNPINYLNAAAFGVPIYTQPFGNAPRNVAKMPAFYDIDFGIHKNFNFTEARYLQFRAESFNLLNHTNFSPPSGLNSNSSGFGVFTSSFPARQVQLALKLIF